MEQFVKCCGEISATGSFTFKIGQYSVRSTPIIMKWEKSFDLLPADQARESHVGSCNLWAISRWYFFCCFLDAIWMNTLQCYRQRVLEKGDLSLNNYRQELSIIYSVYIYTRSNNRHQIINYLSISVKIRTH